MVISIPISLVANNAEHFRPPGLLCHLYSLFGKIFTHLFGVFVFSSLLSFGFLVGSPF